MVRIGGCVAGLGEIDEGLRWFGAAARDGDPGAVVLMRSLSVVRPVDRAADQPLAWRWQSGSGTSRVWVWPGVLGEEPVAGDGFFVEPSFLVVTAQIEDAVHAVLRAGRRMMQVTENGDLLPDDQDHDGDVYTPNSDSVYLTDVGPAVAMDTKGEAGLEMGRTMVHVLVEELDWSGVAALVCRRPADLDRRDFREPADWHSPRLPHDTAPRALYIRRIITADGDGKGGEGRHPQYRRADGSWTADYATAQAFTDETIDLLARLAPSLTRIPGLDVASLPEPHPGHWPNWDRGHDPR
jgi:hypothetical protein